MSVWPSGDSRGSGAAGSRARARPPEPRGHRGLGAALLAACAIAASPAAARANGRFPAAGQIAVDPSDPARVVVRTTFGILTTTDAGKSWGWVCEPAIGYYGAEDPVMGVLRDGTILAGVFEGLAQSRDQGCTWSFVGGGLPLRPIVDVSVDPDDGAKAIVLLLAGGASSGASTTQIWATTDRGMTWAQLGSDLPANLLALTADRARSDANRIYASGTLGAPSYGGVIARSDDGGASWTELPITGTDSTHKPYIAAIDPQSADVIYVRVTGPWCADPQDSLVVSKDGGHSWSPPIFSTHDGGNLLGFALSPDGSTLVLGSAPVIDQGCAGGPGASGLWRAPASTLVFEEVSSLSAACLTWTPGGLYTCASEFQDHFTAGISTDAGDHVTPILHLGAFCPLACGPAASVNATCPAAGVAGPCCAALWEGTAALVNATACTDAGPGSGSTGTGSGSTGTGTGSGSSSGGPPSAPPKRGCGCMTPGSDGRTALTGAALVVAALAAHARRRSSGSPRIRR